MTPRAADPALFARLSRRERETAAFIASGLLNKQIAVEMKIAESTVLRHREALYYKLGIHSAVELTHFALALGVVPPLFVRT